MFENFASSAILRFGILGFAGLIFQLSHAKAQDGRYSSLEEAFRNPELVIELYLSAHTSDTLYKLPDSIDQFVNLEVVSIQSMSIESIPTTICSLYKLRILILSNNVLTSIPPCMGNLKALEMIRLDDNELTSLPKELSMSKNLYYIYLANNPIEQKEKEKLKTQFKWTFIQFEEKWAE